MIPITSLQETIKDKKLYGSKNTCTIMGMPGSGISTVLRDINKTEHGKYLYIDCKDAVEATELNLIKLVIKKLSNYLSAFRGVKIKEEDLNFSDLYNVTNTFFYIFDSVNLQEEVIILLDNFQFTKSLNSIYFEFIKRLLRYNMLKEGAGIKILFLADEYFDPNIMMDKMGGMYEYFFDKIEFISGFKVEEIAEVLNPITEGHQELAIEIHKLSGGNPKLVDRLLDIISDNLEVDNTIENIKLNPDELIKDYNIRVSINRISNSLTSEQKKVILNPNTRINGEDLGNKYLIEAGLIVNINKEKLIENINLLRSFLSASDHTIIIKQVEERGISMLDNLSSQEYAVYEMFKNSGGKLITKNEIAKALWGNNKTNKKTDWAIDQLMKRVRQKIGDPDSHIIQTIRGRGYRFAK